MIERQVDVQHLQARPVMPGQERDLVSACLILAVTLCGCSADTGACDPGPSGESPPDVGGRWLVEEERDDVLEYAIDITQLGDNLTIRDGAAGSTHTATLDGASFSWSGTLGGDYLAATFEARVEVGSTLCGRREIQSEGRQMTYSFRGVRAP